MGGQGDDKQALARARLKELNAAVKYAVKERSQYMDENAHLFAEFQLGEEVVNVRNSSVYVVSKHYFFRGGELRVDESFSVDCRLRRGLTEDNTSHYAGLHPYVPKSDYEQKTVRYLNKLKSLIR